MSITLDKVMLERSSLQPTLTDTDSRTEQSSPHLDESLTIGATISEAARNRQQNEKATQIIQPIENPLQAVQSLNYILHKIVEQKDTVLSAHQKIPQSTVMNLLAPVQVISRQSKITVDSYMEEAQ